MTVAVQRSVHYKNGKKGLEELSRVQLTCDDKMWDAGAFCKLLINTEPLLRKVTWCVGVHSGVKSRYLNTYH